MRSLPARGSTPRSPAGPRCADSSWRLFGEKLFAPCTARAQRMQQLKPVVVPRSYDHAAAPCPPQRREPASLSFDDDPAFADFNGQKTTASIAPKQEAKARVVAAPDRSDSVEVSGQHQIDVTVAVEILRQDCFDGSELSLHGQGLEPEDAFPVVHRNGARKHRGFANLRLFQLSRGDNALKAARAEARVRRVLAAKLRHHSDELVASGERIARAIPEDRHDLFNGAVAEEIVHIHPHRLLATGSYV